MFRRDFELSWRPVMTFRAVQLMPNQVVSHGFAVDQLLRVLGFPHVVLRDMRAAKSDAVAVRITYKIMGMFRTRRLLPVLKVGNKLQQCKTACTWYMPDHHYS